MAVTLNSVVGLNFTLKAKYQYTSRSRVSSTCFSSPVTTFGARRSSNNKVAGLSLSVASSNRVATNRTDSENTERSLSDTKLPLIDPPPLDNSGPQVSDSQPKVKRSSLTARERLRAARVLSRYTESKPSKPELGSNVLDALRESDRGKIRSGLPEAPTNLFDDSKRGLPKKGLTFDFPGGFDLFLIIFSVIFISTVMFTTAYVVWKAGAIHFNEF